MAEIIKITRYAIKNESLAPWIKFIWRMEAEDADMHYKLLPTDCIDVLLNLGSELVYETASGGILAPPFHINGRRCAPSFIRQTGTVRIFGLSFQPYGLFPFVHRPLEGLREEVVDLYTFSQALAQKLVGAVSGRCAVGIPDALEHALLEEFAVTTEFLEKARIIRAFVNTGADFTVQAFCREQAVTIKSFERMALSYTGLTPKRLRNLRRFQITSNQLAHTHGVTMADIAYGNAFTDQAHFINDFRRFSGVAPRRFQAEKVTVKENAIYAYL